MRADLGFPDKISSLSNSRESQLSKHQSVSNLKCQSCLSTLSPGQLRCKAQYEDGSLATHFATISGLMRQNGRHSEKHLLIPCFQVEPEQPPEQDPDTFANIVLQLCCCDYVKPRFPEMAPWCASSMPAAQLLGPLVHFNADEWTASILLQRVGQQPTELRVFRLDHDPDNPAGLKQYKVLGLDKAWTGRVISAGGALPVPVLGAIQDDEVAPPAETDDNDGSSSEADLLDGLFAATNSMKSSAAASLPQSAPETIDHFNLEEELQQIIEDNDLLPAFADLASELSDEDKEVEAGDPQQAEVPHPGSTEDTGVEDSTDDEASMGGDIDVDDLREKCLDLLAEERNPAVVRELLKLDKREMVLWAMPSQDVEQPGKDPPAQRYLGKFYIIKDKVLQVSCRHGCKIMVNVKGERRTWAESLFTKWLAAGLSMSEEAHRALIPRIKAKAQSLPQTEE